MNRTGWKKQLTGVLSFLGGGSSSLLLSSVGIVLLVCVARMLGLWEGVELQTLDLFLRHRPVEAPDERITILEITDDDLQKLGTYPVPDDAMVQLLEQLESYEPRVIGLDIFRDLPVINPFEADLERSRDAHLALMALLEQSASQDVADVVVIEKILAPAVSAPAAVSYDNIGFADALLDADGFVRRSLLASPSDADPDDYHLSFTIQLATKYLAEEGLELNNGLNDANTMRFGETELFRLTANSGGYHNQDTGDNPVVLLNFRNHPQPFQTLSLTEFLADEFPEEWIRDRIILIGMTAVSTKDYINSAAISNTNPGLVPGVELQAHAISQIISTVLENRPLIKTWNTYWEYGWIVVSGLAGLSLIHLKRSISTVAIVFIVFGGVPLILAYGLLLAGVWIPAFPAWFSYFANGIGILFYRIHQYEQSRKIRFNERQRVLESSYNAIHNGPLQTLKSLTRKVSSQQQTVATNGQPAADAIDFQTVTAALHQVDNELRNIYEFMQREYLQRNDLQQSNSADQSQIYLTKNHVIDLSEPFHELLYQVYHNKLQESEGYFKGIKIKISDFCPMDVEHLNPARKEEVLRFLEEALCNVEQHASDVTRLQVTCKQEADNNIIRVSDNGRHQEAETLMTVQASATRPAERTGKYTGKYTGKRTHTAAMQKESYYAREGDGSRQAKRLAKRLKGQFSRQIKVPKGTVCELVWPIKQAATWKR
ncbi:MAG: CHASE2 domain-containing protein [Phormidesmis sp.]